MSSPPDTQDVVDIESLSDVEDDKGPSSPPCSPAPVSTPNDENEVSYVISIRIDYHLLITGNDELLSNHTFSAGRWLMFPLPPHYLSLIAMN